MNQSSPTNVTIDDQWPVGEDPRDESLAIVEVLTLGITFMLDHWRQHICPISPSDNSAFRNRFQSNLPIDGLAVDSGTFWWPY